MSLILYDNQQLVMVDPSKAAGKPGNPSRRPITPASVLRTLRPIWPTATDVSSSICLGRAHLQQPTNVSSPSPATGDPQPISLLLATTPSSFHQLLPLSIQPEPAMHESGSSCARADVHPSPLPAPSARDPPARTNHPIQHGPSPSQI
ncbi:hypothetical protein ACLOJK_031776 [Asimina triloba]